ncbi:MAG TPA: cupin domain-containing protein [Clostridiales bacterium]|nr:cupin domain-containing protein [Clostridiales bacterium]
MESELKQIPKRIKELREILEISAMDMAGKLGISLEDYLLYETGGSDIPISALYKIAAALGTDFTVLITGDSPRMNTYTVVRSGEGVAVERYPGYHFESLAFNFKNRSMEPMLVEISRQDTEPALVMHSGQEFNYVLEGSVKITVGKNVFILNPGDSIYFDASKHHGMKALGGEKVIFLAVIV